MLKRSTKVTSLLVVAASIVSMVPAIAADIQNFDAKDGYIYSAVSKGGGISIIDAELNGQDEAIYCYKDGKYTKLDDAKPGDTISDLCENQYVEMKDASNNYYYVDITTGKETDAYDREIDNKECAIKLRNKIKEDNNGRFSKDTYTNNTVAADAVIGGATTLWSQYSYKLDTTNLIGKEYSEVYADKDGNYVDADYNIGSIRVYTTTGSSVSINNTNDTYEVKEKDGHTYEIKAQIDGDFPYCENPNDFYRKAKLSIWARNKDLNGDYENITNSVEFGVSNNHHAVPVSNDGSTYGDYATVMQIISKAQSSDAVDGIKYAQNVSTYFVTDKDGNAEPVLGLGTSDKTGYAMMSGNPDGLQSIVIDDADKKLYAETVSFKTNNGYNYVDIGNSEETDYDVFGMGSGQIYCIDSGYLKKWNNKDSFEKLYKVDSGMTNLSVNDPGDMIVWDQNKEEYSIISIPPTAPAGTNTAATTTETATAGATSTTSAGVTLTTAGWIKNIDGTWSYAKADGTKATGWVQDGAAWYYLKADGIMATGWQNIGGTWYYLKASGAMQTGWINDNGIWYYCNASGAMLADTTVDGYLLGSNGAWIQ
ncbi:N-acetylmuramoyl-L-alanine amidase family protein [Clostridium sp.]|uniref:N-acetylmuramoyl-L-alanine amidase family protein n=1 Tax=Clostridium sp. TaxID=1506 RepID=UPI0028519CDE|nr:N-acetylmuramoyl-L-alanine amidase family protein [Clostridium sp.]MDR3594391.1 N-acetylmuramoyl-L-alanine amidase family protein [Clostridium sp.]